MNTVATLIVKADSGGDVEGLAVEAASALKAAGAIIGETKSLSRGEAVDIFFTGSTLDGARATLEEAFGDELVDFAVQPAESRRKRMLITDMDSTIIENECIDELAALAGVGEQVAAITEAAMRGELDFEQSLRARVKQLKGLAAGCLEEIWREKIRFTPGAGELVATMNAWGARTVLVSGGFTFFAGRVADALDFAAYHACTLGIENDELTGEVSGSVVDAAAKRTLLIQHRQEVGIDNCSVLALGDGANDIQMIEEAGLGVAYHGKPLTVAAADVAIRHSDLSALLFVQGCPRSEFVSV